MTTERTDEWRWRWLESTRALQREAFRWDWQQFRVDGSYMPQLRQSINDNVTALIAELGEFLQELGPVWKRWADLPDMVYLPERDRAVGELVDVAHFLANILVSLQVTDDEYEGRYRAKQAVNRGRQRTGYDGVTGKCPSCKRDLAEVGTRLRPVDDSGHDVTTVCRACGVRVDG